VKFDLFLSRETISLSYILILFAATNIRWKPCARYFKNYFGNFYKKC